MTCAVLSNISLLSALIVLLSFRVRVLEFEAVARVLEVMNAAGASPVGLVIPELEKNR